MRVDDVMQKEVDFVSPNTSLIDVARVIFGHRINGVPVCKGRRLIGMVTELDILSRFYPSQQEYIEDFTHARDFEGMEEKVKEILDLPVEKVMNRDVTTVKPSTPLLRAQSLMQIKDVGRLPVVDEAGNLIGIVSKGDIFRSIVGRAIPLTNLERYNDFLSKYYDVFVDWEKRLKFETSSLTKLLKKEKVTRILDIGCGTGEHDIELARKGFHVVGIDTSNLMIKISNQKRNKLPQSLRSRVQFVLTEFEDIKNKIGEEFDAAIFMGNALPYIIPSTDNLIKEVKSVLRKKQPLLIFQLLNFYKVLKTKSRLLSFKIAKSHLPGTDEHVFLEFYDLGTKGLLYHNLVVLDSYVTGRRWTYRESLTIPIRYIGKKEIAAILKRFGFSHVSYFGTQGEYQGSYGKFPGEDFKQLESDWLNVIAKG